jgi:hypothetical protein
VLKENNNNPVIFHSIHDEKWSRSSSPEGSSQSSTVEKEESPRKNFVPIPWRVIGGGVLVSTARKDEAEEQPTTDVDCPIPSRPANIALPPLKISTRQRSNSIPSTPSITQVKVEHVSSTSCMFTFNPMYSRCSCAYAAFHSSSPLSPPVFYDLFNDWTDTVCSRVRFSPSLWFPSC